MIEKRLPRKLNKSSDSRVLGVDEMSDALNITVSTNDGGNANVLKPIQGNYALEGDLGVGDNKKVVGKAICTKYDIVYFFVQNDEGDDYIVAYDPNKFLPNTESDSHETIVFSHASLSFPVAGFVKADLTYIQRRFEHEGRVYDDTPFLFFTDNTNEPKKLNVLRACVGDFEEEGVNDFSFACAKTPVHPIVGVIDDENTGWANETTFNQNEFLNIPGFQFAYQSVYRDGFESAISSYSQVFVPPGYLRYTGQSDITLLNAYNAIDLIVPNDDMSPEVESVKVLARRGNEQTWQVVKELPYEGSPISYRFLNNVVGSTVSSDLQTKQFDNLPKKAEAQTIMDNRLFYGNYVDGFDSKELSATIAPVAEDRPADFQSFEVGVLPSVSPSPAPYNSGAQNKNIGFTINAQPLDSTIPEGSFVSFSFTVNPRSSFHVYNAQNSYNQSPQMGEDFDNRGFTTDGVGTVEDWNEGMTTPPFINDPEFTSDVTNHPFGFYWQNPDKSGSNFIKYHADTYDKIPAICSDGVNKVYDEEGDAFLGTKFKWRHFDMQAGASGVGDIENVDFGTSAGNPLIVDANPFTIRCSFTANTQLTRDEVAEVIAAILEGDESDELTAKASNIVYPSSTEMSYTVDLGINNGQSAPSSGRLSKLINTVGPQWTASQVSEGGAYGEATGSSEEVGLDGENSAQGSQARADVVKGFFILNKATVKFGLFRDRGYEERVLTPQHPDPDNTDGLNSERNSLPRARFGVYIKEISVPNDEEAVLSCMRRPQPGSRWWFFAPWNKEGNANILPVDNVLLGEADFREYSLFPHAGGDGLLLNPSFASALGHNGNSPQDEFDPQSYIAVSHPVAGNTLQHEQDVFMDGGVHDAPWKSVLGGLYYRPEYVQYAGDDVVFFKGELPDGTSAYSLMDGQGGPGGGGIDYNSIFDNYLLMGQLGPARTDFALGVGTAGSVGLFGWGGNNDGDAAIDYVLSGLHGPGLDNNIRFGYDFGGWNAPDLDTDRKDPGAQLIGREDDDPDTFQTGIVRASFATNQNISPISNLTTLPLIHLGSSNEQFLNPRIFQEEFQGENPGTNDGFLHLGQNPAYESKITNPSVTNTVLFVLPPGTGGKQSFKAGASHAFGVVFYDERGRCSNVNPIGTSYVPWYGDRSTGSEGPVEQMIITVEGEPPADATHFKFVYSGNTTMSRFVQYSVANAFVSDGIDSGNIYLSLNHLQETSNSFAKSQGARALDGSSQIYTYQEGDRLRIISYYNSPTQRVFMNTAAEFNIVEQKLLGNTTDNPLYDVEVDGERPHPAKQGSFIVVENNKDVIGFTAEDVGQGQGQVDVDSHKWNNRVLVEIYSPRKAQEEEDLVFYEIGPAFPIDELNNEHYLYGGDVWYKTEAVNFQRLGSISMFGSLIQEGSKVPNFFPYNLESQDFNKKVANSDVWGKGKLKVSTVDEEESRKEATITYSEKNNPFSRINTINAFNPVKGQFKDLPSEFGDINHISNNDDSIFVIQSSRCSSVPINRSILTDGANNESLVAAKEVIGTERYYAGEAGCDGNPESVCVVGNTIYFASKSNREIYKFSPSAGVAVISDAGMKSYFQEIFRQAEKDRDEGLGEIRVVGGYNPFEDTYILSVYNEEEPPLPPEPEEDDDVDVDAGDDTGGDPGVDAGDDTGSGADEGAGDDSEDDTSGGSEDDGDGVDNGGGGQFPDSSGPGPIRDPRVTVNPGQEVGDAIEAARRARR